jgi:cobalamin biosynthesis Mg chelatase CobN
MTPPSCAQSCFSSLYSSSDTCKATDIKCICDNKDLINTVAQCVMKNCSGQDIKDSISVAQNVCGTAGVTISQQLIDEANKRASGSSASPSSSASATHSSYPSATPSTSSNSRTSNTPTSSTPTSSEKSSGNKLAVSGVGMCVFVAALFFM